MLTPIEKIIFTLAIFASLYAVWRVVERIRRIIGRGHGKPDWGLARQRLFSVLLKVAALQPTFKIRFWPSLWHAFIAWGFLYYVLINVGDLLEGYLPGFVFLGEGPVGQVYRLLGDLLSVAVLFGMAAMLVRRFVLRSPALTTRQDVLLHPQARWGILRDSAIVGTFILTHVGARFVGQSFKVAAHGADPGNRLPRRWPACGRDGAPPVWFWRNTPPFGWLWAVSWPLCRISSSRNTSTYSLPL